MELQEGIGDPVTLLFDEDLLKPLPLLHHPDLRTSSPPQVRSDLVAAAIHIWGLIPPTWVSMWHMSKRESALVLRPHRLVYCSPYVVTVEGVHAQFPHGVHAQRLL